MRALKWLNRKTGYRGKYLSFLALLDLAYGYSLLTSPAALTKTDLVLPYKVWGVLWVAAGCVCVAGAFMTVDRVAFACAALVKTAWSGVFFYLAVAGSSPFQRAWVGAVIWLAFAATTLMIASWPEPQPPPTMPPDPVVRQGRAE